MSSKFKKKFTKAEPVVRIPFRPSYPPSAEQAEIFDVVECTDANVHIEASPGSGKSTTMVWAMTKEKREKAAALSMGKAISVELEPKCPPNVTVGTAHSFGRRAIATAFPGKYINVFNGKVQAIFKDLYPSLDPTKMEGKKKGEAYSFMFDLVQLINMLRVNLVDENNINEVERIAMQYSLDVNIDRVFGMLPMIYEKILEAPTNIDFTDMMWIPIRMNLPVPQFDMMYVDERQDLNSLMIEYVNRMTKGRIMTVGDSCQCQPVGTKVLMDNELQKNIEDLKVGDRVISYHKRNRNIISSSRVNEIKARPYFGELIKIKTVSKESRSTPNHKWHVKWNDSFKNKHIVYMMLKDGRFRIGITKTIATNCRDSDTLGLSGRCSKERADAAWILRICGDVREAMLYENIYSFKYGIPQVMFYCGNPKSSSQNYFDEFWKEYGDTYSNASNLLSYLDLEMEFPFWEKCATRKRQCLGVAFDVHACNLFSGYMDIPVIYRKGTGERRSIETWETISTSREHYQGLVYSLDVEFTHTYVSDELLTCNSIYGFGGADVKSTERLIKRFGGKQLPLSICYRCGKNIVYLAQTIYDKIKPFDKMHDGEVINAEDIDYDMPDGSMILSRRNANLVKPCFALLRQGRKAIIKGKDIGEGMIRLIESLKASDATDLIDKVEEYRQKRTEVLMRKEEATKSQVEKLNDETQCIIEIASSCQTIADVEGKINIIFDESVNGITLSSIHRSKGLEADEVTIIDYSRVRLSHDKMTEEDHIQEKNLNFVAVTRAKNKLTLVG